MRKNFAVAICICITAVFICSCSSIKSKGTLLTYANREYGKCDFIKEEVTENRNGKVRTIYLVDQETGIEYTVTSELDELNIDGSHLGYSEYTSSSFIERYIDYIRENAEDELEDIENEYGVEISDNLGEINFDERPETGKPEEVAQTVRDVVESYDEKDLLDLSYVVYSEGGQAYLGILDETGKWIENDTYAVIDYVQSVFPDAEYRSSIYGTPESYVNYEDMEKLRALGCDESNSFNTEFFFFSDPKWGTIVAFNLDSIGLDGYMINDYRDFFAEDTLDCDALGIHYGN